ncbi:undecaprenyl-diphosphate phosphatase [Patiriisocius hiemis]|uniref:Undecaprenyl-diphosphatase n=1 Tax=Patiriisocius hiemis TaxID=3075604 RepID=A0ABU2YDY9_9FLAO|nr:undecaprenyl-diphosphate phosphatase [Constantimarinum sp. W242]MDT0556404.1 undecaprenyl-diphosphate phosphatase [Constantimarinum sp. W242]
MEVWEAIVLGVVQGFTEFLPVSSSGHLELGKAILGDTSVPEESLLFTVVLHFATALSTIVVFRKDILEILKGLFSFSWNEETQFVFKIGVSMLPAVVIGLLFEEQLEAFFGGSIAFVGAMLIVTAILLWLADKAKNTEKPVSFKNAFVIGIAQAIAMLPGISRSGATISTSVLLGNDKSKAARFSFLMVIPLIFGKIAKDLLGGELTTSATNYTTLGLGFLAAFVSGLIACTWMIQLVRKSKLSYFAIYCLIVGVIAIIVSLK